jgi:hypothetical protein
MSDRWVLFFAYHFPPENVVGAARPFRFYKYLQRLGYRCHVITAADVKQHPELSAEQVVDPFLENPGNGLGWQVERTVRKLLLPGAIGTQWAFHALQVGRRFLDSHRDDQVVLFSTFPPLGTHLAAWRLSRRTGVPWIADYRDPLAGNPATARLGRHTQTAFAWLDRSFVNAASAVIANTDAAQTALQARFPRLASKIHLIWNGFDPEQRLLAGQLPAGKIRLLSHLGELYEGRTVTPLLASVKRLIDAGRLSPYDLKVQLIGPAEPSCLPDSAFIQQAESSGWLKIIADQRPKSEAQRIAQTSHGLLIIQPHSAVQVPGKLFEYLQIGRPILALVPRDSAIERLLAPGGIPYRCLYPDDPPEVMDAKVLEFLQLDTAPVPPSEWFEKTFNADSQTAMLAALIEQSLPKP